MWDWETRTRWEATWNKIVNKEAGDRSGLIYGMGHAVYTLSDPRAVMLKKTRVIWRRRRACCGI